MTHNILHLIGRKNKLFEHDINANNSKLNTIISDSKFLVLGGAGTIGQAITKAIFKRNRRY